MSIRNKYEAELQEVYSLLLTMCRKVEFAITQAAKALINRDSDLAKELILSDREVDSLERSIEEKCLKILLMEHPVASDFRSVSAVLKMITDLERIGDHASDISELSLQIVKDEPIKKLDHISLMAELAIGMVRDSVQSYINQDIVMARSLNKRDDKVDELFATIMGELVTLIQRDSANANQALLLLMVAKYIERVADHAVNIGEWADYAVSGHHEQS